MHRIRFEAMSFESRQIPYFSPKHLKNVGTIELGRVCLSVHGARCTIFCMYVCHMLHFLLYRYTKSSVVECVAALFAPAAVRRFGSWSKKYFCAAVVKWIANPPDNPRMTSLNPCRGPCIAFFFAYIDVGRWLQSCTQARPRTDKRIGAWIRGSERE